MKRSLVPLLPLALLLLHPVRPGPAAGVVDEPQPWEERFFTVLLGEEDLADYLAMDEEARAEGRRLYWAAQDPTPETGENEREREHQERVVRAIRAFRDGSDRFVWDDRARAAIRFGIPGRTEDFPEGGGAAREVWLYPEILLRFEDRDGDGAFEQDLRPAGEEEGIFARLEIDPAEGRAMAERGARAWRHGQPRFSFDPEAGEDSDLLAGVYAGPGKKGADLIVSLLLPREALRMEEGGRERRALADIRLALRDGERNLLASREVKREPVEPEREGRKGFLLTDSLAAPPGPAKLSVLVRDIRTGETASRTIALVVPDFSGDSVRIGPAILASSIRRLSGGDGVILRRGNRIEPRLDGVFRSGEEAWLYFEVGELGIGRDGRSHLEIAYRLKGGTGGAACPLGGDEGGTLRAGREKRVRLMSRETVASRRVRLDLSSLAPGEYAITIRAEDRTSGTADERTVPFRVAGR